MTTGVLCPVPILAFWDNSGNPAVGGSVLTQIGGSNAATYQDVGLTTPLPNPIPLNSRGEVSTSFGASAQCFLTPNQVYTFTLFDANGNQLWVATYVNGVQVDLTQASLGAILWPYDARFDGAPVVDTGWIYGDPRRFGAIGDDATDDTQALNDWASGAGNLTLPDLTFLVSDEITILSHTTITGCEGSIIHQSVANKAILRATNQTNIQITNVHFKQTAWGGSAYIGHVVFDTQTYGSVENCEIEGHQWAGIYFSAARHCTARSNYLHDSNPLVSATFTVAPVATTVAATLTAPWARPTGPYTVAFTETAGGATEGRQVTFTNGGTTATWVSGLTNNCDAAITIQPAGDSGDIVVHSNPTAAANYNVVDGNFCYGNTLNEGIELQDPYNGVLPTRNVICNNRITAHLSYGIILYMPDTGDSYNEIIGNFIENITGSYALNTSSGAGIYVSGAGIGGTVISGNSLRNCCINTASTTLSPAAIGINGGGIASTGVPIAITGNTISDMTQYHGILVTGILSGGSITGNTIRQPASNITGNGITVTNSDSVSVTGNKITNLNTTSAQRCILVQGLGGVNCTDIALVGNTCTGGHLTQIETAESGGAMVMGLVLSGNVLQGGDSTCIPLQFNNLSATDVSVTGNVIYSSTADCIKQSGSTNIIYNANRLIGGGTVVFETVGVCTGTYFYRSNSGVLGSATCKNAGTGCIVELYGDATPGAGTFAVGDNMRVITATAGQPTGRSCTVAGTPGTWVAWANL